MLPLVPFHIYKYALYIFFATKERLMTLPPFLLSIHSHLPTTTKAHGHESLSY